MVLSPFLPSFAVNPFPVFGSTSSMPPGQKGTYPDFPLTKLLFGPGGRSIDVEVKPLETRGLAL